MLEATTVIRDSLIGTYARSRHIPRRHSGGSTDWGINVDDNRAEYSRSQYRQSGYQTQSTGEAARTKSRGPSHLPDANGIITGFAHRDHAGTPGFWVDNNQ
jgi:hypothetical protein